MPRRSPFLVTPSQGFSRRRFVQGLAAGGVLAGLSTQSLMAFAQQGATVRGAAPVLRGNEFDLVIAESPGELHREARYGDHHQWFSSWAYPALA